MRDTAFDPPAAWRKRIAPTEVVNNQGPLRGVVHDGNARLLHGVAGHAGRVLDRERPEPVLPHAAGGRPARRPALPEGGHRAGHVRAARDRRVHARARLGHRRRPTRARSAPTSRWARWATPASPAPPIWMDPATGVYMILLTNRVHPYGKGDVAELRRRISAAVGTRFAPRDEPTLATAASRSRADEPGGRRGAAPARGIHADRARSPGGRRLRAAGRAHGRPHHQPDRHRRPGPPRGGSAGRGARR